MTEQYLSDDEIRCEEAKTIEQFEEDLLYSPVVPNGQLALAAKLAINRRILACKRFINSYAQFALTEKPPSRESYIHPKYRPDHLFQRLQRDPEAKIRKVIIDGLRDHCRKELLLAFSTDPDEKVRDYAGEAHESLKNHREAIFSRDNKEIGRLAVSYQNSPLLQIDRDEFVSFSVETSETDGQLYTLHVFSSDCNIEAVEDKYQPGQPAVFKFRPYPKSTITTARVGIVIRQGEDVSKKVQLFLPIENPNVD